MFRLVRNEKKVDTNKKIEKKIKFVTVIPYNCIVMIV